MWLIFCEEDCSRFSLNKSTLSWLYEVTSIASILTSISNCSVSRVPANRGRLTPKKPPWSITTSRIISNSKGTQDRRSWYFFFFFLLAATRLAVIDQNSYIDPRSERGRHRKQRQGRIYLPPKKKNRRKAVGKLSSKFSIIPQISSWIALERPSPSPFQITSLRYWFEGSAPSVITRRQSTIDQPKSQITLNTDPPTKSARDLSVKAQVLPHKAGQ